MEQSKPQFSELFEQTILYPDPEMKSRLDLLVGLDEKKLRMSKILGLLVNPDGFLQWIKKHHEGARGISNAVLRRPPLIILAGDVGAGKSELAVTIGDLVARQEKIDVELLPLSLASRGQGRVGEMTQLISAAFGYTIEKAKKLQNGSSKSNGAIILLVDEADALAQSRENDQMHHEDKAGVNAFIRGIDSLGNGRLPAAVIMCTNRPESLDPAVRRRAAEIFIFNRPDEQQRAAVLSNPLTELGIDAPTIQKIVELTGASGGRNYGVTYSDIMQRILPSIVLDAYPDKSVTNESALKIAESIAPTPPFNEN
ncbi:AAA family ATPase [uncultured Flavobacterium sp.]|uniref:AAA family ATPase n=1 Tax=uncultured Flavobacterium sp. TaxID=165435 RepID=UPI00121F6CF5|nr:AAA family ATPase [uncultured Flavobacterium sp.]THD31265.1 MAG: AAA family ATPase [Flavobacterium johnsoniae]